MSRQETLTTASLGPGTGCAEQPAEGPAQTGPWAVQTLGPLSPRFLGESRPGNQTHSPTAGRVLGKAEGHPLRPGAEEGDTGRNAEKRGHFSAIRLGHRLLLLTSVP